MSIQVKIPKPDWGSHLATVILDLEKLRSKELYGEVPAHIFFQLKEIFQILETLGSARIEGNNTTLSEYVERIIERSPNKKESQKELVNLDQGIKFIEDNTDENTELNRAYFSELHKIITKDLVREGSSRPGQLRIENVTVSNHRPPDYVALPDYFQGFLDFLNAPQKEQNQLLMVALAHHRFEYIHPYDNGNGRMGRLLSYALLIKLGFRVKKGRILNPSVVFYADRSKYCRMLSTADSLTDRDLLAWSEYFLLGLKNEIEKIDSLLKTEYVRGSILLPTLKFAYDRENITEMEYRILKYLIGKSDMTMKAQELDHFGITASVSKSRMMTALKEKNIIQSIKRGGRIYTINFVNNYLLRGVIHSLTVKGFVSDFLNTP